MNTEERWEILSAGMDGEADVATVLAAAQAGDGERWETYHLIRASLSDAAMEEWGTGLDEARRRALHEALLQHRHGTLPTSQAMCPVDSGSRAAANQSFYKYFMAVASVLAVVVALWQVWPLDAPAEDMAAAAPATEAVVPTVVQPQAAQVLDDNVSTRAAALPTAASAALSGSAASAVRPAVAVQQNQVDEHVVEQQPKPAP